MIDAPLNIKRGIPVGAFTGPEQQVVDPVRLMIAGIWGPITSQVTERVGATLAWPVINAPLELELKRWGASSLKDLDDNHVLKFVIGMVERQIEEMFVSQKSRSFIAVGTALDWLAFCLRNHSRFEKYHEDLATLERTTRIIVNLFDVIAVVPLCAPRATVLAQGRLWYEFSIHSAILGLLDWYQHTDGLRPDTYLVLPMTEDVSEVVTQIVDTSKDVHARRYARVAQGAKKTATSIQQAASRNPEDLVRGEE